MTILELIQLLQRHDPTATCDIVAKVAAIPLWRDTYPDGPDIWDEHPNDHITVADVHAARALLSRRP